MIDVPPETVGYLPPQNEEAEAGVLGACLVGTDGQRVFAILTVDHGLRPEHFYRPKHRLIFEAMAELADRDEPIDALTVTEKLTNSGALEDAGGSGLVHSLPNSVPSIANYGHYAKIVRDLAFRREVIDTARELQDAARLGERDRIAEATARLLMPDAGIKRITIAGRQDDLVRHVEQQVETIPWPFNKLTEMTGGLWPGHLTIIIGHSTHGKSVVADQVLETARKHGARCCAYLTEMTPLERDLRFVARRADIPLKRLMHGKLMEGEHGRFIRVVGELPFDIVPVGTWTVAELGRDIRRRGLDVAVVDLLNAISGRDTKDIDESIARLAGIANDTGCHVIGCHHLNRARLTGNAYPFEPTQGDIRGSGAVFDLATNVLSIYRKERTVEGDLTGEPGDESVLRFLKVKNGITGQMDVLFNGSRMRFELPREPGTVGSVAA